ncbi:MAG: hypothetical protein ACOCWY_01595, partial [Thermodesulfobacteriota bacterium]
MKQNIIFCLIFLFAFSGCAWFQARDEKTAYEIEGALIDVYGLKGLKNKQNGHANDKRGFQPDKEIEIRYGAQRITITDKVFLGMISILYDPFETPDTDVYENCRK